MASERPKQSEISILDSWEDIDETNVLEENLKRLLPPSKSIDKNCNGNLTPINIILTGDDALRSQYVPPEPAVKILKRPTKESNTNNDTKIFQPKKTLKQREQEYAEARLRILGEAASAVADRPEDKICCIQNKIKSTEVDNVIRLPRGPDGTKGFNIRR